ncbi:winged helix-turn-helix domain-containing protein [Terrabacter aeriphilus]|uniref:Winged helix-turn-helix domain-containing protein n=1 Tax=Terrabacter aeriphilus TaxID=515662 RepID=A0ABP9J3K3_9MICO
MLRYEMTPMDVVTCRFGISPLNEMCLSLRGLRAPGTYASSVAESFLHRPEARPHRSTLLALVNDELSTPDVVNPRPESPSPRLTSELRSLAAAPPRALMHDLDRLWPGCPPPAVNGPSAAVLTRVLVALEAYWTWAFAAFWLRHRSILEADVRHRAARSAGFGLLQALSELHPSISVDETALRARSRMGPSYAAPVRGRQVVFVPSLFTLAASHPSSDAAPPMVIYPARGQRQAVRPDSPVRAAALLSRAKADLLAALAEPRTTTELAAALGKTPSAVNQQLHGLRRAGLVRGARAGKSVLYSATPAGHALLAPADGPVRAGR